MNRPLNLRIGKRIRERRLELGLRQQEVADRIPDSSVGNQYISNWERGTRPSDENLELLAQALEVDVSYFFEDDDPKPPDLEERLSRIERQQEEAIRTMRSMEEILKRAEAQQLLTAEQHALVEQLLAELTRDRSQDEAPTRPAKREQAA